MKLKKNSLTVKIWGYFIAFSILILLFLWFFQIIFIGSFYENSKTKELNNVMNILEREYQNNTLLDSINNISLNTGICIELIRGNTYIYNSTTSNRNCLDSRESIIYKQKFQGSNKSSQTYRLINPRFNNQTLINALKLDNNLYIYSSISLEPLDSTIDILKNQFVIVSIVVLFLSFIIAYFVSKKISNPIIKISNTAKNLSKQNKTSFKINENIDELNTLVDTLNEASMELNKTEELRKEFLANIGHDLKTPLTMIKAYAEMVRDLTYKNKEKREDNLNTIIEEANKLNLLVNDIIELSKLDSNVYELNLEIFDLKELINETINRFSYFINEDNYQIIFIEKSKMLVKADKKRIEQVIYNLLNNAINYTGEDKKIFINISFTEDNYRIEIQDTGKGISSKDLDLIWNKYYKTNKNYSRNKVGTGIGLSIVKSILENHHLKYGVISKKGKGSTFWFEIKREC